MTADIVGTTGAAPAVRFRWATSALVTLLLALALVVADRHGGGLRGVGRGLFTAGVVVAAVPVYQRIRRFRARRATWSLLLAAELLSALAGALYGALPHGANPFAPPTANLVLAVTTSVLAVAFVGSLTVASLRVLDTNMLIDAAAGGLAISSLLAWLYLRGVFEPLSTVINGVGPREHLLVGLSLLAIMIILATAATMIDVTGDRLMIDVAVAAVLISVGEVLAHRDVLVHSSRWGLVIDLCWLGAYVEAGRAAELDDGVTTRAGARRERAFARNQARKIAAFFVLALTVIAISTVFNDPPIVGALAVAALAVLLVRLLVSLRAERLHSNLFEELAVTDPLTGLANRRGFTIGAPETSSSPEALGGVVLIDLDNFKDVNDSLGHRAGDQVLAQLAHRLRASIDGGAVLARLGGDEFAVSCSTGSPDDLQRLASDVAALVREPIVVEGLSLHLSASVGVALRGSAGEHHDELIRKADVAMYRAKERHAGVSVYDFEHDRNDPRRLILYGLVSEAVRDGTIDVHLQPLVDVVEGTVAGWEALARWSPDGYGPIPPERFVRMIEMQGLVVPFTAHVLRRSLHHVSGLGALGASHRLSVNVSERDFVNADFPRVVEATLTDFAFPASRLTIEITEDALANDDARIDQCIRDLRAMGVRVSIDDFGTGYSTLSKLVDFPVDELKIDRSFVSRVLTNHKALAVVRAAVDLAQAMDLVTVAEGVEDEATYTALVELGVDLIQGYHVARPMPPSACAPFLAEFEAHGVGSESATA
ncbi:MAG TPA: EAL domain-containing protein [Acidimicrobiales bacterium]|nr:EAL domain-containing protein [Acidimicrobiales bacterium]